MDTALPVQEPTGNLPIRDRLHHMEATAWRVWGVGGSIRLVLLCAFCGSGLCLAPNPWPSCRPSHDVPLRAEYRVHAAHGWGRQSFGQGFSVARKPEDRGPTGEPGTAWAVSSGRRLSPVYPMLWETAGADAWRLRTQCLNSLWERPCWDGVRYSPPTIVPVRTQGS